MKRTLPLLFALALVGCKKKEAPPKSDDSVAKGAAPAAEKGAPEAAKAAPPVGEDLLNLAAGTLVVDEPEGVDSSIRAWRLFDGNSRSDWGIDKEVISKHPLVIELGGRVTLKTLVVDSADIELPERTPAKIVIEISDKSASEGFAPLAELVPPMPIQNDVRFPVARALPGRWLRITFISRSTEATSQVDIGNLRGYGDWLSHESAPDISGSYQTNQGIVHLKQSGATVTGCREGAAAPIVGGIDGRVFTFTWPDNGDGFTGPGFGVFGSGGKAFMGYWPTKLETPALNPIEIEKKTSDKPGACPGDKKEDPIASELATKGRVRLYGIHFDTDKDVIKSESKPTLDRVAAIMKKDAALKLTIEGHTDSSATHAHNQTLSEARAAAVKAYLVAAGIDAARLAAAGFAETKPVAPNDTPVGRASNRRVELARQ